MNIGIIGASGYTGAELMRVLSQHPEVEVAYVTAYTYAGERVSELYPHLHNYVNICFEEFELERAAKAADLHFIALPHGESMRVVPGLLEAGATVIDLSADYRLKDPEVYSRWYGVEHLSPGLLGDAVYGLPEIEGERLTGSRLVAVPGCYPTATILALAPLARAGILGMDSVVVDAKSGVSGAGRTLSLAAHFAQAEGSVKPYGVGSHRHTPEMEQALKGLSGKECGLVFVPHLVPMSRGILATCYVRVGGDLDEREIDGLYADFYDGSPFVVCLGRDRFPETKAVCGSNYCHLGWRLDPEKGTLVVAAAIDNLVKGASGQAVQCMNLVKGWRETTGLEALGIFP